MPLVSVRRRVRTQLCTSIPACAVLRPVPLSSQVLVRRFLGITIQDDDEAGHDSIEDARTTLRLAHLRLKYGGDEPLMQRHGRVGSEAVCPKAAAGAS